MSAADTPLAPETSAPKLSHLERIINIFTAPSKTFADIKRSSNWLPAWLLIFAFSLAFCYTVGQRVGWDAVFEGNMKMAPASQQARMEQIPAERRDAIMAQQVTFTKYMSYAFPVLSLIGFVIIALLLWGTFSFGSGADVTFGQSLAIVVFSALPSIVKSTLAILILMMRVPEEFFIQNPIGTNLGYFLSVHDTPRFLYGIASALDIFMIWTLVLSSIGFAVVGKVKQGTAYTVVFGWWLAITLIFSGIGAAFAG